MSVDVTSLSSPLSLSQRIDARNALYQTIRAFFAARGVREVETPLLTSTTALDCHLHSIAADVTNRGMQYLQTSPELAMKKCIAAGSGSIFQLCKAFRDGEVGRQHRPEFTMLEWYRPGLSFAGLIQETCDLLSLCLPIASITQISYQALFQKTFACNPHTATLEHLQTLAAQQSSVHEPHRLVLEDALDCLITEAIHAFYLDKPQYTLLILTDFPSCQAAMSTIVEQDNVAVCKRFEVYVDGLELANGYDELIDAAEQRARFQAALEERANRRLPQPPIDEALLQAMAAGMPEMTGIALGVDRLLMLQTGSAKLTDILLV